MISAQPVKTLTEILENILEAPVEVFGDLHVVNKQRELAIKTGNSTLCFKIDYEITFQNIHQQGKMLNKAELLLLPEELPVFSSALISQSVSLPTNYTQRLVMETDVFCLYMESQELPELFAERFAAALKAVIN
ncbi:DUF1259 domain-containing protein [Planococcus sp. SE5232]|nr:hypothetical protein [uncultured Planococcus sp.]